MNAETKRHIDAARQVLVGVVPNPTSQIDQITNALIYKFMDDMDQQAIRAGGEPAFFVDSLEQYSWTKIMNPRIGNQERMNLYSEALLKFSESAQLPDLFREIFKSAFLPYRSPETLGLFLKEIDYFDYSHPEELGNAYEYLLSIMSSQGDAGQFRTPRHIIDFMVDVMNPSKDEKILDPACGTAGFLVSSYNHILEQHDGKDDPHNSEKPLTPDDRRKLANNFEGYDVDPGMVRISQVNMYLHQFKNPKIFQYNTLSMDERWNDKFDVILANPPFMSPKGGVSTHNKFSISSNRSEVLFADYIMNHLKHNGRAAVIVPEGIIFQSGIGHKQLRKNMIEDGLYAVVSLPSGVFQPYSGVKTSILLFNNELSKLSKEILFVKVENDGFDLGATKRPNTKNDLPQALKELRAFETLLQTGKLTTTFTERIKSENSIDSLVIHHDKFILVKKSHIAESGDYNLSGDRYKTSKLQENNLWPMVELGTIFDMINGRAFRKEEWKSSGIPIIRIANLNDIDAFFNYFDGKYEKKIEVNNGDLLFSWSGTRGTSFGPHIWGRNKGLLNQHIFKFVPLLKDINIRFAFNVIKTLVPEIEQQAHGAGGLVHITKEKLKKFKIPLPPIEIQDKIVKELDRYSAIIEGAKQIAKSWKPKIDIDSDWENVKLGMVVNFVGGYAFKSELLKKEKSSDMDFPVIKIGNVGRNGEIEITNPQYYPFNKSFEKFLIKKGDILIAMTGATVGKVAISKYDNLFLNQRVGLVRPDEKILLKHFLKSVLFSNKFYEYCQMNAGGGAQGNISPNQIKQFEIPLPPLEIQEQIVGKIEAERELVESAKKLIKIYEDKTKFALEKLYGSTNN